MFDQQPTATLTLGECTMKETGRGIGKEVFSKLPKKLDIFCKWLNQYISSLDRYRPLIMVNQPNLRFFTVFQTNPGDLGQKLLVG